MLSRLPKSSPQRGCHRALSGGTRKDGGGTTEAVGECDSDFDSGKPAAKARRGMIASSKKRLCEGAKKRWGCDSTGGVTPALAQPRCPMKISQVLLRI